MNTDASFQTKTTKGEEKAYLLRLVNNHQSKKLGGEVNKTLPENWICNVLTISHHLFKKLSIRNLLSHNDQKPTLHVKLSSTKSVSPSTVSRQLSTFWVNHYCVVMCTELQRLMTSPRLLMLSKTHVNTAQKYQNIEAHPVLLLINPAQQWLFRQKHFTTLMNTTSSSEICCG